MNEEDDDNVYLAIKTVDNAITVRDVLRKFLLGVFANFLGDLKAPKTRCY